MGVMRVFSRWSITAAETRGPRAWHGPRRISARLSAFRYGLKVTAWRTGAGRLLPLFAGIPIHVFIAAGATCDAASPVEAARQFKRSIARQLAGLRRCRNKIPLGIYEKRFPPECWLETVTACSAGFDLLVSPDERTDARLARLDWSRTAPRAGQGVIAETRRPGTIDVPCAPSSFSVGSEDDAVRKQDWTSCVKPFSWRRDVGTGDPAGGLRCLLPAGE